MRLVWFASVHISTWRIEIQSQTEKIKINMDNFLKKTTVVTNKKRNDCRLLQRGISISKKERRRKLFRFHLFITVNYK